MYNWNVDTKILGKNKEEYSIWRSEQLINFGLNNEKLSKSELKKYWKKLIIDPERKNVLQMWLCPKQF